MKNVIKYLFLLFLASGCTNKNGEFRVSNVYYTDVCFVDFWHGQLEEYFLYFEEGSFRFVVEDQEVTHWIFKSNGKEYKGEGGFLYYDEEDVLVNFNADRFTSVVYTPDDCRIIPQR